MKSDMPGYLIAYDITCPKRLQRIHRHLVNIATPIQYSIFYLETDERNIDGHLEEIAALIDPKTDDLRCYPLPARGISERIGKPTLPLGICWTGLPAQWMAGDISEESGNDCQAPLQQIDNHERIDRSE